MYKHKAYMTSRRYQILQLIAKGYNNKEIAKEMNLSLANTKLQKWRLYCYLGNVHCAIDAIVAAMQYKILSQDELSEEIKEKIKLIKNIGL